MAITYNLDAYGTFARVSAVADFFELVVLKGRRVSLADLEDFLVEDAGMLVQDVLIDNLLSGPSVDEMDDGQEGAAVNGVRPVEGATDAARRVMSMFQQRAHILGSLYPFDTARGALGLRPKVRIASSPYVALLSLTAAHAHRLQTQYEPTQVFEETVNRVIQKRIPRTVGLAAARRQSGGFVRALAGACADLMLQTQGQGVVLSRYTHDAGCDTLSHLDWGDLRVGRWVFVGQTTCAKSDDWEMKAQQARPDRWQQVFGDPLYPTPFLAVPHHVEDMKLRSLLQDTRTLVIDRLRLVPFMKSLVVEEKAIAEAVLAEHVEYL